MTDAIRKEIRFAELRHLNTAAKPTGILHKAITILLGLALLTTCCAIVEQGDELCKQLGIDPWISGMAVIGVWGWACLWFVCRESRRMGT